MFNSFIRVCIIEMALQKIISCWLSFDTARNAVVKPKTECQSVNANKILRFRIMSSRVLV